MILKMKTNYNKVDGFLTRREKDEWRKKVWLKMSGWKPDNLGGRVFNPSKRVDVVEDKRSARRVGNPMLVDGFLTRQRRGAADKAGCIGLETR